jgi:CubicO group peptidase (beta-lactamase class C family)
MQQNQHLPLRQRVRVLATLVLAASTLLLTAAGSARAQITTVRRVPSVMTGAATMVARHGLTSAQFQAEFDRLGRDGFRLKSVTGYVSGGLRFAALWERTSGPAYIARHNLSAAQYQSEFETHGAAGYRLTYISGYEVNGADFYAAIWTRTSGPAWVARHALSAADYQQAFTELTAQGFRLQHISGYTRGGAVRYAAIFDKSAGPAWVARHGMTSQQYQAAADQYGGEGYRLTSLSGYRVGTTDTYAATWEKSGGLPASTRHGITEASYQAVFDNHQYQGYRPTIIGAFTSSGGARFYGAWENPVMRGASLQLIADRIGSYMSTQGAPGLALAIAKDERLVYAAGFGTANRATGEPVGPTSLFRIASVSKPVTGIAVMRLVENNRLSLDDRVFGPAGILGATYPTPRGNERIENITVRQLLQHTAGFSNVPDDPMFQSTALTHQQLITWVLGASERFVTRDPGTRYDYSNFGFAVLGRVIERRSGRSYEQYVRENVLAPAGITDMWIGRNAASQRRAREVTYYPSSAYNLNVQRFDAHGGWIASPIDLVRLLAHVDGRASKADILSSASRTTMLAPAGVRDAAGRDPQYALGWGFWDDWWHNGAMSGTIAFMAFEADGYTVAAAVNQRLAGDGDSATLRQLLRDIIRDVGSWPAHDLF